MRILKQILILAQLKLNAASFDPKIASPSLITSSKFVCMFNVGLFACKDRGRMLMLNVTLCVVVPPGNKGPLTDRRTADIQFPVPGYGRREAVEILLNAGANVHARDDGGLIPLHNACSFGHAEVVSLLLRAGADPNARDNWSYTPLHEGSVLREYAL